MADMQTDLYGSLGAIVETWQAHIGAAPDDAEAIDAAFRCLLMLDAIERTLRPLEDMARGVLSEAGTKAGGVQTDYGTVRVVTAHQRVKWDTNRLNELLAHPAMSAVLAPLRTVTDVPASVRIELGASKKRGDK